MHPYDLEDAAGALDHALATPLDERATIAAKLRDARDRARRRRLGRGSRRDTLDLTDRLRVAGAARDRVEQRDQTRGTVDETRRPRRAMRRASPATPHRSGPRGRAGRRPRPARARRTRRGHRCRRRRTRRRAKPFDQRVDRRALVDRDRRPELDREPAVPLGEPVPAGELGRDRRAPRRPRSGAVRQCNVTLTPPLRSTITPGSRASASSAAAATASAIRQRHADPPAARRRPTSPSRRGRREQQTREWQAARRGTRPDGRSRSRPVPSRPTSRRNTVDRLRERDGIVGSIDDRRERSVVVDRAERCRPGAR